MVVTFEEMSEEKQMFSSSPVVDEHIVIQESHVHVQYTIDHLICVLCISCTDCPYAS